MEEKNGFRKGEDVYHDGWGLRGEIISLDTGEDDTVLVKFEEPTDHGDVLDVETKHLVKIKPPKRRR